MCHRRCVAAVTGLAVAVGWFMAGPVVASGVSGVAGGLMALAWRAVG